MALTIEIKKAVRKEFHVDEVQVTSENMAAVAEWCQGEVRTEEHENAEKGRTVIDRYVKVRVHRPLNDRQTKAYVGDHVLYAGSGYKVYTDKAFNNSFENVGAVASEGDALLDAILDPITIQPQGTQELFVTAALA